MAERSFSGNDDKRRVLEATDIVRLIGEQVALRKQGREFKCLCPFHDDHNPSMYVVPLKQMYHCFVCGAGGNALTFAVDYFKMPFREALQFLADRAGIQLSPPPKRNAGGTGDEVVVPGVSREAILSANKAATEFFRAILRHPQHGAAARALIERRGVSPAMVEQFQLGAAPDRWDGLGLTLANKGLDPSVFLAAGLLKARDQEGGGGGGGGAYDAQRNRLIFPIHDTLGRVIAFGGRKISDDSVTDAKGPKYLNSPETLVFSKSATLYGLTFAAQAIRTQNRAIVTEGYMDCIACHQAGVTNVVATLGTALTAQGARVLRRLCDTIVLLFDGDDAGQRAADRAVEILFAEPVDVRIATMSAANEAGGRGDLPVAKDPDELLKQPGGAARFATMIDASIDALEWWAQRLKTRTAGLGLSARATAIDEEIARLSELGLRNIQPVRQRMIVGRIAAMAGVDEATIRRQLPAGARRPAPAGAAGEAATEGAEGKAGATRTSGTPRELLLGCLLSDPSLMDQLDDADRAWLTDEAEGLSAALARAVLEAGPNAAMSQVQASLEDRRASALAAALVAEVDRRTGGDHAQVLETWRGVLEDARRRRVLARGAQETDPMVRLAASRQVHAAGGNPRAFPKIPSR